MYLCVSVPIGSDVFSSAQCSSVVETLLIAQWVIRSIHHGGPTELFLVPASAP